MKTKQTSIQAITGVAELLGDLRDEVVFVGGSSIPLLITDLGAGEERATDDVDVVVEATTPVTYYALTDRLKKQGFREDHRDDPPVICRWCQGDYRVDVMPMDGTFLGFKGAWFKAVWARPMLVEVKKGLQVRVSRAPELIATKIEAYADRGNGDYVVSHDIEDIIAIVNGRAELLDEIRDAPDDVRNFVCATISAWVLDDAFMEAVPGMLAGDAGSQARVGLLLARLESLAALASKEPSGEDA